MQNSRERKNVWVVTRSLCEKKVAKECYSPENVIEIVLESKKVMRNTFKVYTEAARQVLIKEFWSWVFIMLHVVSFWLHQPRVYYIHMDCHDDFDER